jgi:hypothetical protein
MVTLERDDCGHSSTGSRRVFCLMLGLHARHRASPRRLTVTHSDMQHRLREERGAPKPDSGRPRNNGGSLAKNDQHGRERGLHSH